MIRIADTCFYLICTLSTCITKADVISTYILILAITIAIAARVSRLCIFLWLWLNPFCMIVRNFLIQKSSRFSNVALSWSGLFPRSFNCSIIVNLASLLKWWFNRLKCWQTSKVSALCTSSLCLFILMLKGHSLFPTYCFRQMIHSSRYMTNLLWQFTRWWILNFSFVTLLWNSLVFRICKQQRLLRRVLHELHHPFTVRTSLVQFTWLSTIVLWPIKAQSLAQ